MYEALLKSTPEYQKIAESLHTPGPAALFGLPPAGRALLYAALQKDLGRLVCIVTPGEAEATHFADDLKALGLTAAVFPPRDFMLRPVEGAGREYEYRRLSVLGALAGGRLNAVCVPAEALLQYTVPRDEFLRNTLTLKPGMVYNREALVARLFAAGYVRRSQVDGPGQFSVRGDIVDIYAPDMHQPARVEYWDDEIDSLASFDLLTQRRDGSLEKIYLSPAREVLFGSTAEIKQDMEKPYPMDRLLCGDVGVGKTEVALRAAFKCVMGGKQCALLAPTTLLAWQHYNTLLSRMEAFPVKVGMLSRFRTAKQQKETLRGLQSGSVDIVVGTHRLLSKDVRFHDLGLVIIDEEQRFGVKHKEKLKENFIGVDMLTLSATPIPRTLNMAMSGIRDLSTIEQPPIERQPVETFVLEYNDVILAEAMKKELARGGQVYYLHNRVDNIESTAAHVSQLVPGARVGIAHGKMTEEELNPVWQHLLNGEIDILVCTTLIETGIDVRNCNTLIIEDADRMGLAQLYQIRGRVGRSGRKAYAYFTFRRDKTLTDIAQKRLSAIREFTAFGSGFRIAMRDLQIRGAGSLLGHSQHGHMEAVGYDLYVKMLGQAIARAKGEPVQRDKSECLIDLRVDAYIPEKYIADGPGRIEAYKRIAAIQTPEDATDVLDELIDRYGDPPPSVSDLVNVSLARVQATAVGVYEVTQKKDTLVLQVEQLDLRMIQGLLVAFNGRVVTGAGAKPYLSVTLQKEEKPLELLQSILRAMQDILKD